MTTQLPDVTDDDTTTAEAPVTTTEDDVTKLTGTFEDTTTKPSDTTTQPSDITIKLNDNSSKDPSNASCKDLIKVFEAKEDHLKQYYKNDHATLFPDFPQINTLVIWLDSKSKIWHRSLTVFSVILLLESSIAFQITASASHAGIEEGEKKLSFSSSSSSSSSSVIICCLKKKH